MIIKSKDNDKIKEIKKLKLKKYRREKYIVEGTRMVEEAIKENADIELIVVRSGSNIEFDYSKYDSIEVTESIFNELTEVVSPQGILAIISKKNDNNEIDTSVDYMIALDGIQDPGNLGTIIRTADSANLKQIIISKNTVDAYSPKVIRSTMGAIYRIRIIEVDKIVDTLNNLKNSGFKIVTTQLDANSSIYDVDYSNKVVVIGNEANGVSEEVKEISDIKLKIPMLGKTESLNASVATGIMIYEYVRQKININKN